MKKEKIEYDDEFLDESYKLIKMITENYDLSNDELNEIDEFIKDMNKDLQKIKKSFKSDKFINTAKAVQALLEKGIDDVKRET